MPNYRRAFLPGGTFFFTLVTHDRRPILCEPAARAMLHGAFDECRRERPFDLLAVVLLPDHLHAIWRLPAGDPDYASRWSFIKSAFTRGWLAAGGAESAVSASRRRNRRRGVWQRRFWEHCLRDQDDLNRHADYIHYNPVKHGFARCPHEWEWSSFERWMGANFYERDWCCVCNDNRVFEPPDFSWANEFDLE
jgi:putative transposase